MRNVAWNRALLAAILVCLSGTGFADGGTGYDGGDPGQAAIPRISDKAITQEAVYEIFDRCMYTGSKVSRRPSLLQKLYKLIYRNPLRAEQMVSHDPIFEPAVTPIEDRLHMIQVDPSAQGPTYDVYLQKKSMNAIFRPDGGSSLISLSRQGSFNYSTYGPTTGATYLAFTGYSPLDSSASVSNDGMKIDLVDIPERGVITTVSAPHYQGSGQSLEHFKMADVGMLIAQVNEEKYLDEWGNPGRGNFLSNFRLQVPKTLKIQNSKSKKVLKEIDLTDYRQCLQTELHAAGQTIQE